MRFIDATLRRREEERLAIYSTNRDTPSERVRCDPLSKSTLQPTTLATGRLRATSQYVCLDDIRKDIEAIDSMEKSLRMAETQKIPLENFLSRDPSNNTAKTHAKRIGGARYREIPGAPRNSTGLRININQGNLEMVPSLSNSSRSSQGGETRKRSRGEENFRAQASATEGSRKTKGDSDEKRERGAGGLGALARMLGFGGGGARLAKRSGEGHRAEFVKGDEKNVEEKPSNHFQVERTKIFCKISGLKGDIDNEPHSPRSSKGGLEGSF